MTERKSTDHLFKREEAVKFIKQAKAGTKFCLHVRNDAPVDGDQGKVYPMGLCGYVRISRADAIRLCGDFVSEALEIKGARIPVSVVDGSVGSLRSVTYWIG